MLLLFSDGVSGKGKGRSAGHEHALRLVSTDARQKGPTALKYGGNQNGGKLTRRLLERGEEGQGGRGALGTLSAALEAFRPDLVMLSAGFDGRRGHPCGKGELAAEDYEWITREVCVCKSWLILLYYYECRCC